MISLLGLFALFGLSLALTPVVIWHGMGDSCCNPLSMGRIRRLIEENGPKKIYVKSLMLGSNIFTDIEHGYLANMNDLVAEACRQVQADENLRDGFHALGFSQGGLFVRALAQRCSSPPIRNLISVGGPQQGIFGFPYCLGEDAICDTVRGMLNLGAYVGFVQNNLVQAQYWHDPTTDRYIEKSVFLADLNCDRECNHTLYTTNLVRLHNMVLVKFLQDEMVVPKESEWFGYYPKGDTKRVKTFNETEFYTQNKLGLRTLFDEDRLHFLSVDGDHLRFTEEFFINEIINKYFIA